MQPDGSSKLRRVVVRGGRLNIRRRAQFSLPPPAMREAAGPTGWAARSAAAGASAVGVRRVPACDAVPVEIAYA